MSDGSPRIRIGVGLFLFALAVLLLSLAYFPDWDCTVIPLTMIIAGVTASIAGILLVWWPEGLLISAVLIFLGFLILPLAQVVDRPPRQVETLDVDPGVILQVEYPANLQLGEPQPVSFSLQRDLPSTMTITHAFTSTVMLTYPVAVSTSVDGIGISNQDGNSTAVERGLSLGSDASAWTLYLIQRKEITRNTGLMVPVTVTVISSTGPESTSLPIQAEIAFKTALRMLGQVLASPVVPIVAIAGLAISWLGEERRRTEERRRVLEQEVERIKELHPCRRLEEYLRKALLLSSQERAALWMGIRFPGWEEMALQRVLEVLDMQEDVGEARCWFNMVEAKSPEHELIPIFQRLLREDEIASDGELTSQEVSSYEEGRITPDEALRIFQTLGGSGTAAERIALKQLSQVDFSNLSEKWIDWTDQSDMRYLLRKLREKRGLPEGLGGKIKGYGYQWPTVWPSIHPADARVSKALKKWEFGREKSDGKDQAMEAEPFGPENAELASSLEHVFYPPRLWDTFLLPTPLWIWGPSGSGHTALALMLCYRCSHSPPPSLRKVFPIHLSLQHFSTQQELAGQILRGSVRSLLRFLTLNPYGFLEQDAADKGGMAELIRWMYPEMERLAQTFHRMGTNIERGGGKWVMDILQTVVPPCGVEEEPSHWLRFVPPAGYSHLYLLLETNGTLAPEQSRILERWATRWPGADIYLKVLEKRAVDPSVESIGPVRLQVNLVEMLRKRLKWILPSSGGSLQSLCETGVGNPDEALVQAASGSPRKLVQLGNRLLKAWVQRNEGNDEISHRDFEEIGIDLSSLDKSA
jgi:hypothetical protein